MWTLSLLVCLVVLITCGTASNILLWFPSPSGSHAILGKGFAKHLLNAGHKVTLLSCYPSPEEKNLIQPDLSFFLKAIYSESRFQDLVLTLNGTLKFDKPSVLTQFIQDFNKLMLSHETIVHLLTSQKFDAVVLEWFFNDMLIGLGSVLDCPVILFSSTDVHSMILPLVEAPRSPVASLHLKIPEVAPYSFFGRIKLLFAETTLNGHLSFIHRPAEESLYNSHLKPIASKLGRTIPEYSYSTLRNSVSFLFYNGFPSLGTAQSLPPNVRGIGGYHIDRPTKELPQDLQKIMDDSKEGVIYFSMGSLLNMDNISESLKEHLLNIFGSLRQTVIWKFGGELQNKPDNVHLRNWLPQKSILAHPNTKLFISHGGLLSMIEAIHFRVPLLGVPIFGDQFLNMARAQKKGFAKTTTISDKCFPGCFKDALQEILETKSYLETITNLSTLYHDRLVPPERELVYWLEHVIRTEGAPHLTSITKNIPIYQTLYLDFLALLVLLVLLIRFLCRKLFCTKTDVVTQTKKNK